MRPQRFALGVTLLLAVSCSGRTQTNTVALNNPPPPPADDGGTLSSPSDDEQRPPDARRGGPGPLRVVERRAETSPLVTVRVVFESGSADDPRGHEGLTNALARTMTEGGTEALTYEELTRRLFPMAATITVHVDRDMTVFTGQVHRDHLTAFYPLFRDVLLRPRLADGDFRRVRTQALSELTQDLRNDDERLQREFLQAVIYQNHPYGHPALGTETGLNALTHAELSAHRARVFCRDRALVGVAGGYPSEFAAQLRTELEAGLAAQCPERTVPTPPERPQGIRVVVVDKPTARATAISFGYPVNPSRTDADFPAVYLANAFIGLHRQSSGRLYNTLREVRGLNYGDYSYAEHFEQAGYTRFPETNLSRRQQYASVWIRPVPNEKAHFALRAALRVVSRTLEYGLPPADFERTRTFLSAYVSLYAQTESARLGYALDDRWSGAETPFLDRLRTAFPAMTADSVLTTARRHLTAQNLWVVIVSPNARALADAIGAETASPITYDSPKPPEVMAEDRDIQVFPLRVGVENVRVVPVAETFR